MTEITETAGKQHLCQMSIEGQFTSSSLRSDTPKGASFGNSLPHDNLTQIALPRGSEHLCHLAPRHSAANPFAARIRARLRSKGGQYRPTTPADEATVRREQVLVDMARETAELHAGPEPAPF